MLVYCGIASSDAGRRRQADKVLVRAKFEQGEIISTTAPLCFLHPRSVVWAIVFF
jgi:hypothetical protein